MDDDILKTDDSVEKELDETETEEVEAELIEAEKNSVNKLEKIGGVALGGTALAGVIKVILSNEQLALAIDTVKNNKKAVIFGGIALTGLYFFKRKKITFSYKDNDRKIEFSAK